VNRARQQGPHAHSANLAPDNRFAFVADLGLDKVLVYKFDAAKGTIEANAPPFAAVSPGAGPRHFAFHPSGKFAYVINEMGNTVTAFSYHAAGGALTSLQTISTLPQGFSGTSYCAEVVVHPSGKFLYGSNRGHDSIAVFAIDPAKGTLTAIEQTPTGGKWPRNFNIDPTGAYLFAANEQSNDIFLFHIDPATGKLKPTGKKIVVSKPVCIKFLSLK
jgi:6-phosphogluconolactonase